MEACATGTYLYITAPIQPQLHATFGSGIIFFRQLHGHSITDISKFVQDSTKFCSPHTILLRDIACATLIFPASCIEIA